MQTSTVSSNKLQQLKTELEIWRSQQTGHKLTLSLPMDWLKVEVICNNFLRG
jgi:hypothetical protein